MEADDMTMPDDEMKRLREAIEAIETKKKAANSIIATPMQVPCGSHVAIASGWHIPVEEQGKRIKDLERTVEDLETKAAKQEATIDNLKADTEALKAKLNKLTVALAILHDELLAGKHRSDPQPCKGPPNP